MYLKPRHFHRIQQLDNTGVTSAGPVFCPLCQLRTSVWPTEASSFIAVIRSCQSDKPKAAFPTEMLHIKNPHFKGSVLIHIFFFKEEMNSQIRLLVNQILGVAE